MNSLSQSAPNAHKKYGGISGKVEDWSNSPLWSRCADETKRHKLLSQVPGLFLNKNPTSEAVGLGENAGNIQATETQAKTNGF